MSYQGELTKPSSQQELNTPQPQNTGISPGNPFDEAPFMPESATKNTSNASDVSTMGKYSP